MLAWDTSSQVGALVALEGDPSQAFGSSAVSLVAEICFNVNARHSEKLLWGIHQLLEAARWRLEEIDLFAVGVGPGSFTGLRIGLTTARTLAHILKKPLIAISSLAALARPTALALLRPAPFDRAILIAVTDACKGELFVRWGEADQLCQAQAGWDWEADRVSKPETLVDELLAFLKLQPQTGWILVGEGRKRYMTEWNRLPVQQTINVPVPYSDFVQGRYLGLLAWEAMQAGQQHSDALEVHPRYLRASEAELRLKGFQKAWALESK